jgi:hypothetical protein
LDLKKQNDIIRGAAQCFLTVAFNETYILEKRVLTGKQYASNSTSYKEKDVFSSHEDILVITEGTEDSDLIPIQIENANLTSKITKTLSYSIYSLFLGSVASNIFLETSLLTIWGLLANLQLLGVLSVISIPITGEPSFIIETIMKIAMIDIIPTEKIQQRFFYIDIYEDEALNSYFQWASYRSKWAIINLG